MFEKFRDDARAAVVRAEEAARDTGSRSVDSRHVLAGLLRTDGSASRLLRSVGVDPDALADRVGVQLRAGGLDADALASLGIDLDAVRARADAVFGRGALDAAGRPPGGHLPFSAEAKKALELSLREAINHGASGIDGRMLLLGLLRDTRSPAAVELQRTLAAAGSSSAALRAAADGFETEAP